MIIPKRLKVGDTIGLVSPSRELKTGWKQLFHNAVGEVEEKLGLKVRLGKYVWEKHFYSAGTPAERVRDFHSMVKDKDIKAIILTIGGKSAIHLLEHLNWDLIRENPKIITGISDSTTILAPITEKTGLITYHGTEFIKTWGLGLSKFEVNNIKATWFNGNPNKTVKHNKDWSILKPTDVKESTQIWQVFRHGKASGRLCGGNITCTMFLDGTEYGNDYSNKILILEAYDWKDESLHAGLNALRLRGVFKQIKGLILGYMYNHLVEETERNRPLRDIVLEVTDGYDFPIMYIPDIGHCVRNILMPIGIQATIDTKRLKLKFNERTVI